MLYAFLGSALLGSLSTLYLLWRKSVVETDLASTTKDLQISQTAAAGWQQTYLNLQKADQDQISRRDTQILTLQGQNDAYLKELQKAGAAGVFSDLLQKRNTGA